MQFERRNKRPRFGCAHLVCLLLPLLWPDDPPVTAAYPVAVQGTVVTAGQGSAPGRGGCAAA